jgi:hypothetical protein
MPKEYFLVHTATLVGGGFAGFNCVVSGQVSPGGYMKRYEEHPARERAEAAAEEVFRASGAYPGYRFMAAVVRVDGGRAVVCQSRGRRGW